MPPFGWHPTEEMRAHLRAGWERRRSRLPGFWDLVDKSAGPDACWPWLGSPSGPGYGGFERFGVRHLAHRRSYELAVGPIPEGLEIDHLCRNRGCVNPAHLEPVTGRENTRRAIWKAICKRGHDLSVEAQYKKDGRRYCGACNRQRQRERKQYLRAYLAEVNRDAA